MNFEFPTDPRQALEASLTALLLGELTDEQARFLRQAIATDPELAKTFESLKKTIELVRETESGSIPAPEAAADTPRLSEDRRKELLQKFKTVRPAQFEEPVHRKSSWLVPIAACAALLAVLAGLLVRPFSTKRSFAERNLEELVRLRPLTSTNGISLAFSHLGRAPVASDARELARQSGEGPSAGDEMFRRRYGLSRKISDSVPAPLTQDIVLPQEPNRVSFSLAQNTADESKKQVGQSSFGVGGDLALGETTQREPQKNTDGANERALVLGDTLANGKIAQPESAPGNTPELAGNNKEWSVSAGLRGFYADAPAPWIRALEENRSGTTAKDQTQLGIPQQTVALPSGGGGIGGGALVEPSTPQQAQQLQASATSPTASSDVNSLNIVGSSTMKTSQMFDTDGKPLTSSTSGAPDSSGAQLSTFGPVITPLPGTRSGDIPSIQAEAGKLPDGEAGRKVALAELDDSEKRVMIERTKEAIESTDLSGSKKEAQPAQAAPAQGAHYGGGAFGGYAYIKPSELRPGQKLETVTIQGVGEVPVISDQPKQDRQETKQESPPASNVPIQLLITNAIANIDDLKKGARPRTLAQSIENADSGAEFKKEERSKSLAGAVRDAARTDAEDLAIAKPAVAAPEPLPEIRSSDNPFSTFSLNVSDVSFKLAAASLEKGQLPDPASIRSEEFINAFDYRDPEAAAGAPIAFAWERGRFPFAQNRDLLRFSVKTAAAGRQAGRPLNVVLLLDNSGSMERADRVSIIHEALRVLAAQLGKQDTLSVVTFARTARLWVDGISGDQAGRVAEELSSLTPQGGTNLEEAMNLAYQTALRHYLANGMNRVVLLTDGAANLGDTNPEALKNRVESNRKQGIALDCFGIGWEGYNDDLLEVLTRNGDGRYGFLNTPEEAASEFAGQLAGALHVAANDVKVQVEFNTNRVSAYRQVGYAQHQLTQEQFRDNSVNAAAIGAAESGNALYVIETNPQGEGPLAVVHVRYRIPGTDEYREQEWTVPYTGAAAPLEQTSPAMRLAATVAAFAEWLASSPYAAEVTSDRLLGFLNGVPPVYGADPRPQKLEWMIRQAKALSGK